MKIVQPSVVEIVEPNALLKIEAATRAAYQSFDRVNEGSAERLLKMILTRTPAHTSVLEHYRIKFLVTNSKFSSAGQIVGWMSEYSKYLTITENLANMYSVKYKTYWVSGNIRAFWDLIRVHHYNHAICILHGFLKHNFPIFFDYLPDTAIEVVSGEDATCYSHLYEDPDYATFSVDTDRGVSHEQVRNRDISPTQESTRYCNYGNSGVVFMDPIPFGWSMGTDFLQEVLNIREILPIEVATVAAKTVTKNIKLQTTWLTAIKCSEIFYLQMLADGATPQEARSVLPNSLKTNLVLTGTFKQWEHYLSLRDTKEAHPQISKPIAAEIRRLLGDRIPNK